MVSRHKWLLLPAVIVTAVAVSLCLLLGGWEPAPRESQAEYRPAMPREAAVAHTHRATAPTPGLSSKEHKKTVEALLAKGDAASRKELADLHFQMGRDLQHMIERRAMNGNPELKRELTAASKAALAGPDRDRKVAALQTLHRLAAGEAADEALALLSQDEPPEVTEAAIGYLGRVNCHEAFDRVLERARDSRDLRVKATAIRNLVLVGGRKHPEKVVAVVETALSAPDLRLQAEALRILGRFPEQVTPAIRERVKELAEGEAKERMAADVKEAARMLSEHLEALAKMPHDMEGR